MASFSAGGGGGGGGGSTTRRLGVLTRHIQVSLACLLILLGSFDQILGYFVPVTVFFLALSAAAVLRLPRPPADNNVFRAPLDPLPIPLFLLLIASALDQNGRSRSAWSMHLQRPGIACRVGVQSIGQTLTTA